MNFTVKSGRKLRLSSSSDSSEDEKPKEKISFVVVPTPSTPKLEEPALIIPSSSSSSSIPLEKKPSESVADSRPSRVRFASVSNDDSFPSSFARVLTAPTTATAAPTRVDPRVLRVVERSLRAQFSFLNCRNVFSFDTPPPAELRKAHVVQHKTFA